MGEFSEFFRQASVAEGAPDGYEPYGYQARVARDGLPSMLAAPTGTGKTAIILAWLWRRLYAAPESTPRRLVYALPQPSLVDQVAGEARRWLASLGLAEQVALHVVMGAAAESQRQWRLDMHQPAIVVGTVDSLVSKALNRGYGIGRAAYPIDCALVTNGAHWVIDEIGLCPRSAATMRRLAGFTEAFGTAEPFGLTCMSATVPEARLEPGAVRIAPEERTGELEVRLAAVRTIKRLDAEPGDYEAIAAAAGNRHRAGTLTLAVLNTVEAARAVYQALRGGPVQCTLLHSRYRALERAELMAAVTGHREDRIVVATQAVEAGMDLSAAVLITEAAPWPSLVQRAGRCNRAGRVPDAELWWVPPIGPHPYEQADIDASSTALSSLDGHVVTGEDLLSRDVAIIETQVDVLRRGDLTALFDTAPHPSETDVDISPYIRDGEDLDAQLAWATWTADTATGHGHGRASVRGLASRSRLSLPGLAPRGRRPRAGRPSMAPGSGARPVDRGDPAGRDPTRRGLPGQRRRRRIRPGHGL